MLALNEIESLLQELSEKYKNAVFAKVDVDNANLVIHKNCIKTVENSIKIYFFILGRCSYKIRSQLYANFRIH